MFKKMELLFLLMVANDHLFKKALFIRFTERLSFCVCVSFTFGF